MAEVSIDELMRRGVTEHQAGRLAEAQEIYQQVIVRSGNHAEALHLLGVLAGQRGRREEAVGFFRRAIAIRAEPVYWNNLGIALKGMERMEEAMAAHREALALKPDFAEARFNLANLLGASGRMEEAMGEYRETLRFRPEYAAAHHHLGNLLCAAGKANEAVACYQRALLLKPNDAEISNNLGVALMAGGRAAEAVAAFGNAIRLKGDFADAQYNLGNALKEGGRLEEAIGCFGEAVRLAPEHAEACVNLGGALQARGSLEEAIFFLQRAVKLKPEMAGAWNNLGAALSAADRIDEAVAAYLRALSLQPDFAEAYNNLGFVLKDRGDLEDAIACYRQALACRPDYVTAHSNLLNTLHFHPGYDAAAIREELARFNERFCAPLKQFMEPHDNDRDPDRRLRIGYVSPDFREHVVGRNLVPLFTQRDRAGFAVFCYSNVSRPDALTAQFQAQADGWRSIVGVSDADAAELIRRDGIDILVDLSLHMAGNRLLVFARKPAPVQVTFAGYPGSTGLEAMDYRLTDPFLDPPLPPGISDSAYVEESLRLPHSFWCYDPMGETCGVNELPAPVHGAVTFGGLNNFCKINADVLELWAKVLNGVNGSRLMLLVKEGRHRQRVLETLRREGIDPARVELVAFQPRADYLKLYHRIDIGLDTFPYNGHTTSLDSFWMGVPVVTLVGSTVVGRAGLCQLTNLGLPELIAYTPEEYVRIAGELAADLPRLSALRTSLRERMRTSPLMDAPRFARGIEAAFRGMWQNWCRTQ